MERNPLYSLIMGLRGGGGTSEGARAYPGGNVVRAYHGTTEGPVGRYDVLKGSPNLGIEPKEIRSGPRFSEPGPHRTERGVFFTNDPGTASRYAGSHPVEHLEQMESKSSFWPFGDSYYEPRSGSKVFPVDLDMRNSVTVDLTKIPGITEKQRWYDPRIVQTAIETARQNNKDFVVIKGMQDIGGEADQIIAVRPANKVKSAITGETLYTPLAEILAGALAAGSVSRRQRADETTVPLNMQR